MSKRSSVGRRVSLDKMIESNARTVGESWARDACMSIGREMVIVVGILSWWMMNIRWVHLVEDYKHSPRTSEDQDNYGCYDILKQRA